MNPLSKPVLLLALSLSLWACGGGSGDSPASDVTATQAPEDAGQSPAVSWYSAARPLIERYCVACHTEGGVAPFALERYEQVYGKRSAMVYTLEADVMPPLGYADLRPEESRLLLQWLNDGAPKGDASQAPVQQLTRFSYHGEVRAIIEEKCVGCHQQGGIAPFPLETYEQVRSVAAAAAHSIDNNTMPPWPPSAGFTRFSNERALSAEQRYVLLDWLQGEMPEGNPADYLPPDDSSAVVEPVNFNLKLQLPQAYTPTLRPDDHRCFAIEWPLDEFSYVTNVDVLPDQVAEVHHVIVSIAEPENAATYFAADGQDGRPGWYCLGAGGVSGAPLPRQIGGWVPGAGREPIPMGTGAGVRPGSVMVVQMHYNTLVAEPAPDQSSILVATSAEVERPARNFLLADPKWLRPGGMPIPAGESAVHHEATFPAWGLALVFGEQAGVGRRDPWVMHQGFLHMHNLGASGRTTLLRANGTEQVILDIRDWDFNWQGTYNFERELLVQPDDRIKLECTWDNSQDNQEFVNGVQREVGYVEWGDGTGDEMCLMSVLMTRPKPGYDYSYHPGLQLESPVYRQRFQPGDLVPLKLVLNNFRLHDPGQHDHTDPQLHDPASGHSGAGDDHSQVFTGHYHVYLDTDDDSAEYLTAWDENYYYQLPEGIEPGEHRLRVSLRGADHHPLGIDQEVLFEVVSDTAAPSRELVAVVDWAEQDADSDGWAGHRPGSVACPANSWYDEDGALEVETGLCNYLSLAQPGKVEIRRGDTLHLVLWHGDLAFEEPARAHVAITIDGKQVWEAEVAIPAAAEIYDVRVPLDFDAPVGSLVEYHLHNHGYNTWTLLKLEIEH